MKKEVNKIKVRDVNPFLKWLRNRMLGRDLDYSKAIRHEYDISDRTLPPPDLPEGVNHKLFANNYYLRDARRNISPPLLITDGIGDVRKFPVQESEGKYLTKSASGVLPGKLYNPPSEPTMPIRDPAKLAKLQQQKQG